MRPRLIVLVSILVVALVALGHRSRVQAWAYGSHDGVRSLEGAPAPEFPTQTRALDGAPVTMRALRGDVVLVHFWTFGCSNCRHMLPRYGAWLDRFGARGLVVVGVHTPELDYERSTAALADEAIWGRFRVAAWPTIVLVGRDGVVRATFVGDDEAPAIEAALVRLLQ
jgi:thiol-disulfide isomerase/thioredoxin